MTTTTELSKTDQQVMNFIQVVCNQREGLVDNGWLDCWCVENDLHQETQRMTPVQFAEHLIKLGWEIVDAERAQARCPECAVGKERTDWAPGMSEDFARADERDNFGE